MSQLWEALKQHALDKPAEPALLRYDGKLETVHTWHSLRQSVEELANRLSMARIETLALLGDNTPQWIIVDLACDLAGIVSLPLPSFFSAQQVQHALTSVRVDALLVQPNYEPTCEAVNAMHGLGRLAGFELLLPNSHESAASKARALPECTSKITFTSGSTGAPKGVCLSQKHMETVCTSLLEVTNDSNVMRHLCVLPFATLLENLAGIHTPLRRGAQVIVADQSSLGFNGASGFSLPTFVQAIHACEPNSMVLIPQLLEALVLAKDAGVELPESFRFIAVGGATVSTAILERAWGYGMPVYEGYGLSECGSVVSLNGMSQCKNGSLGKPLRHCQVEIDDGEIVVRGPLFLGYVDDEASATPVNGVFHTGDLGCIDDEGYLHFEGRRKNVIVSSFGRNINPEWVEAEISCFPQISQCFVFGDSRPYCVALVAAPTKTVTDAEIQDAISKANAKLPEYAQVKRWHRLGKPLELGKGRPLDLMTSNGRPRRGQIAQQYAEQIDFMYVSQALEQVG
ncbi:MAG: AMP-binding protein [Pseudohongiellaceae bacterium]|nr:AMP-binding protein [Pseudohongiellaceae bacterium]